MEKNKKYYYILFHTSFYDHKTSEFKTKLFDLYLWLRVKFNIPLVTISPGFLKKESLEDWSYDKTHLGFDLLSSTRYQVRSNDFNKVINIKNEITKSKKWL